MGALHAQIKRPRLERSDQSPPPRRLTQETPIDACRQSARLRALTARLACATALAASLTACALGPRYEQSALEIPAEFRASAATAPAAWPDASWWRGFGDATLDSLIAQARANNTDLAAAAARIAQADAQLRIAGAPLLPSVSLGGSGSFTRESASRATRGGSSSRMLDLRSYSVGPDISWQVDFWGRTQALTDSQLAQAIASRFDQESVALTVTTAVASTWFQALGTTDRLAVAERNLADAEQILQVIRARLDAGTATALDVAQQETLAASQRAAIPGLRLQIQQAVNGLGILLGRPPEAVTPRPGSLTNLPVPNVVPGLPSELLARRPDIAAAEARLKGASANIRAARAAFYPSIVLTGSGGWQSTALSALFGPGAFATTLAANITAPLFDGGQRSGQLALSRAQSDELVATYRKSVLQAFTDTENALSAVAENTEQEDLQRRAVASAERAVLISRARLDAGTIDVTTLLNTQASLYNAQDNLAQVRLARMLSVINLYKALGGGWTLPAPQG